jgi:hypothetical protein
MATQYIEFDTTAQNLFADLRTQILTSTDWARLTPDTTLLVTSAATAAGATSLPFASTSGSGLAVGSVIMIDDGATREYRTITAITATAITVAAMTYAHASGIPIRWGSELYKGTTTRGAQMVIDLNDTPLAANGTALSMAIYQSHDGTNAGTPSMNGVGRAQRYLYWRVSAGAATHTLHVVLSVGKEHFYLSIEGPRGGETGSANGQYGSLRQYVFLCDLVPYDVGDTTPVVFAGGSSTAAADGAFTNFSHIGHVSKNLAGTGNWAPARLATLDFPKGGWGDTLNLQRQRQADNMFMLAPYVVFLDDTGMRGRLSSFFFAGFNWPDNNYEVPPPPVGTKVQYQGDWYKLLPVNKSEASRNCWAQFGAVTQSNGTLYARSPVVAVPCLP